MPNLYNPNKFNMFGFFKEVKQRVNEFNVSNTQIVINIQNVFLSHTYLLSNVIYIKIGTNANEILGAMRLMRIEIKNKIYFVVERVGIAEKHRNKGIVKYLYQHAIELELNIMSDSTHTTFGSKDLWLKFPQYFPQKTMSVLNIDTHYKRQFINQKHYTIWGKENDEDFDILEKEDKIYLIEELYASNIISKDQQKFFIDNIENINDKSNIRLLIE